MILGVIKPSDATDFEFKLRFSAGDGWILSTEPLTMVPTQWYEIARSNVRCPTHATNWEMGLELIGKRSHAACKVKGVKPTIPTTTYQVTTNMNYPSNYRWQVFLKQILFNSITIDYMSLF